MNFKICNSKVPTEALWWRDVQNGISTNRRKLDYTVIVCG